MKIGLIGCGTIGTEIAGHLEQKQIDLVNVSDSDQKQIEEFLKKTEVNPKVCTIKELVQNSDIIFEAASKEAVKDMLTHDLSGKKIVALSAAGLVENLKQVRNQKDTKFIIPSGAIAGLDAIGSVAKLIESLELITTKPRDGLANAPFVVKNNINIEKIEQKEVIFSGNLSEAIEGFPQNINVAASIFLSSGFEDMKITIVVDPKAKYNTHEIRCKGSFGTVHTKTENKPSKNAKTSYLAVLSALKQVDSLERNILIA